MSPSSLLPLSLCCIHTPVIDRPDGVNQSIREGNLNLKSFRDRQPETDVLRREFHSPITGHMDGWNRRVALAFRTSYSQIITLKTRSTFNCVLTSKHSYVQIPNMRSTTGKGISFRLDREDQLGGLSHPPQLLDPGAAAAAPLLLVPSSHASSALGAPLGETRQIMSCCCCLSS